MKGDNQRFYRPELDVLRFLAFMLVFLFHAPGANGGIFGAAHVAGALGVCLFFLLSSYLITELLEREYTRCRDIHLKAFYMRRILRIWPLYFLILGVDFALQHVQHPGVFTASRLLAFLLLTGNWYVAAHGFTYTLSTPLWSISVEEQFYILWPSVRKFLDRRGSFIFSIAMLLLSYAVLLLLCRRHVDSANTVWVDSFVQFQFFSTGALVALSLRGRVPDLHPAARALMFSGGIAALVLAVYIFKVKEEGILAQFHLAAPGYLIVNAACILLLLSFLGEGRLGGSRILVYLGQISYGLYVFHWIMLRIAIRVCAGLPLQLRGSALIVDALGLFLTIAVASVSFHFFERPILRYKSRFEFIKTRQA